MPAFLFGEVDFVMPFKYFLIIAVCINSFCGAFMGTSVFVAIPALAEDFAVPPEYITAVVNAYVIAVTACLIPTIAIVSKIGNKKGFIFGSVTSALASFLIALSPNLYFMVTLRALQGITNAFIFSTIYALLMENTDHKQRGTLIGLTTACVYAGISCAPFIGGFLTDTVGWWSMFTISGLGNIASALLCLKVPPSSTVEHKIPYLKALLALCGFVMLFIGLSTFVNHASGLFILFGGLLLIGLYVYRELITKNHLINITLLRDNQILNGSLLSAAFHYLSTFAISMLLSMYLQLVYGVSATEAGLILVIQPVVQCLVSPLSGRLADSITPHVISLCGLALTAISLVMLCFISLDSSLVLINIAQVVSGLGFGLFSAPNSTIIMSSVTKDNYAMASGMQALVRNLGMALCMAMVTSVFFCTITSDKGTELYREELVASIQLIFMLSAFFTLIAAGLLARSYKAALKVRS